MMQIVQYLSEIYVYYRSNKKNSYESTQELFADEMSALTSSVSSSLSWSVSLSDTDEEDFFNKNYNDFILGGERQPRASCIDIRDGLTTMISWSIMNCNQYIRHWINNVLRKKKNQLGNETQSKQKH